MKIIQVTQNNCKACKDVEKFMSIAGFEVDETIHLQESEEDRVSYALNELQVMSTPTFLLLDDNEEIVDRVSGFNPPEIEELINKL